MNQTHANEREIQDYVLNEPGCERAVIEHIESCASCQEEIKTYRLLFSEIKKQSVPVFDFDLSARVLTQLPSPKAHSSADRFVAGFLLIFACCFIGIPVIMFWQYILNIFSGIPAFFIYAMIISAIVIMVIKMLDMYKKFQKQMHLLNFN
jgi:hypothetical protein